MVQVQVQRGDVIWVNFGGQATSAMNKVRPAVVVQNNMANRFAPHTIVAGIRHDTGKTLPVLVPVGSGIAGLTKDSMVDAGHLLTIKNEHIDSIIGRLGPKEMAAVDQALKHSLALR